MTPGRGWSTQHLKSRMGKTAELDDPERQLFASWIEIADTPGSEFAGQLRAPLVALFSWVACGAVRGRFFKDVKPNLSSFSQQARKEAGFLILVPDEVSPRIRAVATAA